jgi:uncharacterized Tic20 family protein
VRHLPIPERRGPCTSYERTWSILAHLSILLNLITGIGGPVAALIIWLLYKDRSQKLAFRALQSLWYQVEWLVILSVGWFIPYILMSVIIAAITLSIVVSLTATRGKRTGEGDDESEEHENGEDPRSPKRRADVPEEELTGRSQR